MMRTDDIIQKIKQTEPGQDVQVLDNLVMFRVDKHRFRYGQSYALLRGDQMILIDAVHAATRAAIDRWRNTHTPAALILTHSDLLAQAFGPLSEVSAWLDAPVIIHSQDRSGQAAEAIEDVQDTLHQHQLRYFHVPGHTLGSIMIYAEPEQYLFAGDAAVGANYEKESTDFTHPPIDASDWSHFEEQWSQVDVPVKHLFPLHGKPAFAVEDMDLFKQALLVSDNVMQE